ncbi:hypothetical protein ACJ5H2_12355 [Nocardioides sp. R1-1]|uniref:hypothetical protein n=1 Tax=Nocardioides sp. R1-1 TaxID=3383502 RepID=UPI0038D15C25
MTTYTGGSTPSSPGTPGPGGGAQEQAREAVGTAKEETQHVAEVARGEAQNVAAEAKSQAAHLLEDARAQIEEQSSTQLDRFAGMLREFGDDLERMVRGEPSQGGPAQELVGEVAEKARALRSQIEGRQPAELLDQVRDFARRRPGTFLLGSLAAGVLAGRLTRGAKTAHDGGSADTAPADTAPAGVPAGTAAAAPLAGTGTPPTDPVYPEGTGPIASTP